MRLLKIFLVLFSILMLVTIIQEMKADLEAVKGMGVWLR